LMREDIMYDETTPVLIVGGSLVGLSTSLFLSWYGIPSLLVERHGGISPFPRAGGFNPRTMELFRAVGVEAAIRDAEPADLENRSIVRVETLAGKEISVFAQNLSEFVSAAGPVRGSVITQDVLEPILRVYAEDMGGDLRFNTELVSFKQDADGITAMIRDVMSGAERTIRARYLVAADGHSSAIRQRLGIATDGPGTLAHVVNMIFHADLRAALRGRRMIVCYITQVQGVFGGDDNGGLMAIPYHPEKGERAEDFAGSRGADVIRAAVGVPDLPVEVVRTHGWEMAACVAERFQQGRVFLAGDSAHVMPPTGRFGANTGIADAHNLAWKLAHVIKGLAGPELLGTYDAERRPVAQFTVEQAFANYVERIDPQRASERTAPRVDADVVIFGYRYHSSAILSEAEAREPYEDPHHPTGRPGSRAPHIALERNGERFSTIDLFGRHFVLLAGAHGGAWRDASLRAADRLGIELVARRIGAGGDLLDVDGCWAASYGVTPAGAVLVRPDGFVGWRAAAAHAHPERTIEQALVRLLSRESESTIEA
jgi:putative polyketide hydroxylase